MITFETYTIEWITGLRKRIGKRTDPKLIEKVVYTLALLEQLRIHELDLIFKGGSSIMLATEAPTRFSIDVDIITQHSEKEITAVLDKIVQAGPFTVWKPDNDRKHVIDAPIIHYKLYYNSNVDGKTEPVLLDVLYSLNPYPAVRELPVAHPWLKQEGQPVTVSMPTFDSILGDKLTAYAPETTGILYIKNRPVEIIKQLYDIALLFDRMEDIAVTRQSFMNIVAEEISSRKLKIDWHDVLDDIQNTSYVLVQRDGDSEFFGHLHTGIRNIANFIIGRFSIDEAITAGAKAAYLSELLRVDDPVMPTRFSNPAAIALWTIQHPGYPKLNKLKKANPEAFYYWYRTMELKAAD